MRRPEKRTQPVNIGTLSTISPTTPAPDGATHRGNNGMVTPMSVEHCGGTTEGDDTRTLPVSDTRSTAADDSPVGGETTNTTTISPTTRSWDPAPPPAAPARGDAAEVLVAVCGPRGDGPREVLRVPLSDAWLIWSNQHDAWWGPAFAGYFVSPLAAGLYTREAAEKECDSRYTTRLGQPEEEAHALVDVLARCKGRAPTAPSLADALRALVADAERLAALEREVAALREMNATQAESISLLLSFVADKTGATWGDYERWLNERGEAPAPAHPRVAELEREAARLRQDAARLDSGTIRLEVQVADGRQGILYCDVDLRACIDDANARLAARAQAQRPAGAGEGEPCS